MLQLLTATQRGTSLSPAASSAYRHPMAAVRATDDLFANAAAAAVLALATLDEVQRNNRDGDRLMTPRAPNERFARGKSAAKTCVLEHSSRRVQTS